MSFLSSRLGVWVEPQCIAALQFSREFLGKIPFHQELRIASDKGRPLTFHLPDHKVSLLFKKIIKKIIKKLSNK